MIDGPATLGTHPAIYFWLDVADKGIKLFAVFVGASWAFWNYRKSRTYAQKLDIQLTGNVFFKDALYIDVAIVMNNLGAARQDLQPAGTSCDVIAVHEDLTEESVRLFPIFRLHNQIEPGESIQDHVLWRIQTPRKDLVWVRVDVRVVSGKVEWNTTSMTRVE